MATRTRRPVRRSLRDRIGNPYTRITHSPRYDRVVLFVRRKPVVSFLIALLLLLGVLVLGSILGNLGKKSIENPTPTKSVSVYTIGKSPTVALQAKIEKDGVVQIVAQTPGIVRTVHVQEGDTLKQGQSLVSLSSNYQGGNAPALQAQLAGAQLQNVTSTYNTQKEIISQQRNIATASAENTEQLRQISDRSLGETRDLLSSNEDLLEDLNDYIDQNPNDPNITTLRSQANQLQSGVNQLRGTVRSLEYQTNTNNPPTLLSSSQKEIALKQLDIQEKALDLNKKVSYIQYNLALVQEGTMHPAAPFAGTVERVNVHVGQNVTPGTVIATISRSEICTTAVLNVSENIALSLSRVEPSVFHINGKKISLTPSYVSSVATTGQLYSVIYTFPDGVYNSLTDGEYVTVDVPVGYAASSGVEPFVPLESVYQSENESTVYVIQDKKAVARKVTLGEVYGSYIAISQGLHDGDKVILDRNVVAGDSIQPITE